MSSDKLIQSPGESLPSHAASGAVGPALPQLPDPQAGWQEEHPSEGLDLRRYLFALVRYKWLVLGALLLGVAGAAFVWKRASVQYTAEGNLWVEVDRGGGGGGSGGGDVTPIRAAGLLESNAWIQLLRSYAVLDSVVMQEALYVEAPTEYSEAFATLTLADEFAPGSYELVTGPTGREFALTAANGVVVQEGEFGEPIGLDLGLYWAPRVGSFPPDTRVPFAIRTPRDASRELSERLRAQMDEDGNFIRLAIDGDDPERITSILNTLMDRHVDLAAELKRSKLDETLAILEEQLQYTEDELARAEQDLEQFRVTTITLPSDQSTPITPGLEVTRDPVFGNFFDMKIEVEEIRRDRERLQAVLASIPEAGVRVEALEAIATAAASSELRSVLTELVEARSEVRVLRDRYSDDFPPVRELLTRIETLETQTIPQVVRGIVLQLAVRENQAQDLVDSASAELAAIPPRTIEEGRLRRRVAITENLYNELRSRVETARLAAASSIPDVRVLDRAATPQFPTSDNRIRFAAMILLGCLGSAMGGAILLDRLDRRFRYANDVSRDTGLDILGRIPRIQSRRRGRMAVNAAQALEAFRELRIHVGFAYGSAGPLTLTVSSPSAGEGKSLISANLAVAFAEVGRRTLLIDGDTRRGDAHRLLGRNRAPGLVDYLRHRTDDDIIQSTDIANLDFIGSGSRGATTPELLASPRMAHFMGALKRSYEVIIVDSPPLASGGDPLILASLTGNLAVVIRTGSTEKQLAQAKLEPLSRLPIRVLGVILNDVDPKGGQDYYYTNYLPSYEPVPEGEDSDGVRLLSDGNA